ncbi:MAG: GNAT family N-acetyltransferase [Marinosulfonomonas sp.]
MNVTPMTVQQLAMVLDWTKDEGWNPGLDDAAAFFAADPDGFFLSEINGQPAAAISVVNHDQEHAFLGLYICRPEFRGQGHGLALWQAALAHAGGRSVSLDGVPDQQANYAKSGFVATGGTTRYRGFAPAPSDVTRPAQQADLPTLIAADARSVGHTRSTFTSAWFRETETRQTVILQENPAAFATFRQCGDGLKIGPFYAPDAHTARALLGAAPNRWATGPIYIDVPAQSPRLAALLESLSFEPSFHTARMVKGPPPQGSPPEFYAVATLELG